MDTDVEVIKPLDRFLVHKAFSGYENETSIPTGIIASEKKGKWIEALLRDYDDKKFILEDKKMNLETNVIQITRTTLKMHPETILNNKYTDLKDVVFYPKEYFCPIDLITLKKVITANTYTIHWFSGSWLENKVKVRKKIKKILNVVTFGLFNKLYIKVKKIK